MLINDHQYGVGENSYKAAGELLGITQLWDAFYANMDCFPEAQKIRQMHGAELAEVRQKFTLMVLRKANRSRQSSNTISDYFSKAGNVTLPLIPNRCRAE